MESFGTGKMRKTYLTAIAIAVVFLGWMLSGQFGATDRSAPLTLAELNLQREAASEDRALTRVRARIIQAQPRTSSVVIRGRTENKRTVSVKAEISGRIIERPIEKGSRVEAGELLCRISTEDREARVAEAKAAVIQAQMEYQGRRQLGDRGLISGTVLATSKSKLASADAQLTRRELDLAHTQVRAPFAGLIEDTLVETGDFVQPGTACATVIDLDPMLLVGRIAEREVHQLTLDAQATGTLIDGRDVTGVVSFIGRQSDSATRTYAVEIEVPNSDYLLRSGITTEIRIPVATVLAHRISPSLLALDDEGRVGIRTLDGDNQVVFNLIDILDDDQGSIWVAGLPGVATLITVGQELVVPGEQVEVSFESDSPDARAGKMIGAANLNSATADTEPDPAPDTAS
jgi:multidrug efflux system membrane fusion protein